MVGLSDGEKFEDIYTRLDSIPACNGQTDGRTDILPQHSTRYAYVSHGKNGKGKLRGHSVNPDSPATWLLNQCVCLLKLNLYRNVISSCQKTINEGTV